MKPELPVSEIGCDIIRDEEIRGLHNGNLPSIGVNITFPGHT
ncbi:hypothetical protein [uncultured Bacteroides sp.]|nr:hypothetical protein [uncultured Bacteroides sp.]